MCGSAEEYRQEYLSQHASTPMLSATDFLEVARFLASEEELRRSAVGFIGYGKTQPGDKVLLAVDSHYDPRISEALVTALRERGAKVDVVVFEAELGPDRPFDELDEIRVVMRHESPDLVPRRWDYVKWLEEVAARHHYSLVIHGKGGPIPKTEHRYEAIPWLQEEQFLSPATVFPREVHTVINHKTWEAFYHRGRGGRVRLTDPEGTDISWTLFEEYFDSGRMGSGPTPYWGHVMAHAATPIIPREDATGVVAGTTTHFSRPFPRIRVVVQDGRVEAVEGGNRYGEAWRNLLEEARHTQYPCFPRPGLFWLWEVAIGTNPKISRPKKIHLLSSGGFEWERRRSGIIHMGFGTLWRAPEEAWAASQGILYGHLHVHLLFPTLVIEAKNGETIPVIVNGHLTALDDPEVRAVAAKYGDPDRILKEDWIPDIPGISVPGDYDSYARDPAAWIYREAQG